MNKGQGNELIAKLEGAITKLENGQPHVVVNRLNAFINQVMSLMNDGVLTPDQGHPVIDGAADIRWQIEMGF